MKPVIADLSRPIYIGRSNPALHVMYVLNTEMYILSKTQKLPALLRKGAFYYKLRINTELGLQLKQAAGT